MYILESETLDDVIETFENGDINPCISDEGLIADFKQLGYSENDARVAANNVFIQEHQDRSKIS